MLVNLPAPLFAQTLYHLHAETSTTSGSRQLQVAGPDVAFVTLQSADFKNQPPTSGAIASFDTQTGVPNNIGTIPAGSTVNFSVWMRKTANWGTFFPRVWLYLNNYDFSGLGGTALCFATGGSALSTTFVKYNLSCVTTSTISMVAADRWFLAVGINLTAGPGNKSVRVELRLEGVLNGDYDSTGTAPAVVPPPPLVTSLSPFIGPVGTSVTVTGQNFGASQGSSTIKLNGVTATATNWTATSVTATVPATATSGPIVVTVGGQISNSLTFNVSTVGSVAGVVTRASNGAPIEGATVQVLQAGVVKASVTTNSAGQYASGSLPSGAYDSRVSAAGYATEVAVGLIVGGGGATTLNIALGIPGTLSGQITQQGSGPPPGASVAASLAGVVLASTTADAGGNYTLTLKPGVYAIEASAPGYTSSTQSGAVVSESGTTVVNLSLSSVARPRSPIPTTSSVGWPASRTRRATPLVIPTTRWATF